jgi:hypothetical protein
VGERRRNHDSAGTALTGVTPIEIGGQVATLPTTHRASPYLKERLRFEEHDGQARLIRGKPSRDALSFLGKSFGFVRVVRRRALLLGALIFVFASLAAWAGSSYFAEREARQQAQHQRDRALIQLLASEARRAATDVGSPDYIERAGALALASIAKSRETHSLVQADAVEAATTALMLLPQGFLSHGSWVTFLALLADGRLASGGLDRTIKLWPGKGEGAPVVVPQGSEVKPLAALADED